MQVTPLREAPEDIGLANAAEHYYPQLSATLNLLLSRSDKASSEFNPGTLLPELTPRVRDFFSVSGLAFSRLGEYKGKHLSLLNLAQNPGTRTTKTLASLVTVARAVRFIQDTGERVMILTPSSANKATAMRDAVLRAVEAGLVTPEQLSVSAVVPRSSTPKLWASRLNDDPELQARNPVAVFPGAEPSDVKALARHVVDHYAAPLKDATGVNLWYTLDLDNYMAADVMRAFAEAELFPATTSRLHVHAVSSAYGLLGHARGHELLDESRRKELPEPHYLLVQHLGTPDMVLSLYRGGTDRDLLPTYHHDDRLGLFVQHEDPRFPSTTLDPDEVLDTTFYTRKPPTSARMNELIRTQGGGGIVVSLHECLTRYAQSRALLRQGGVTVPADPRALREWSLVMAVTGLLNAIDRGLVAEDDVLVHGSGCYGVDDFTPLAPAALHTVHDGDMLRDVVFKAAEA
ncbi:DUF6002 family protein [Streptomyces sp. NBC_00536]|uniref:DUF6002 family protein n=1 Tax=Streptomyces sp. NBC_00536 TaxID=2975769 RepID=UPI002E807F4E|nr:DUF6002 family protein [Streptomyces sp. NBC_00536]WUC76896.1 DUF6002 family protein [Streptomyces sp. NBC_00536]